MGENQFLHNIFNDRDFNPAELAEIIPRFKKVTFSKNDYLLQAGQIEQHYWFVESGFARSYVIDTEGNDISTNFYAQGEIVIEWSSFFLRAPTREHIQALSACTCWQLDFNSFQELFHSIAAFREQGRKTLVGSYFALKKQSVSMIADPAKERYLQLLKDRPHIIQNISLKYIASYLGVTDTSLSRIRKEILEA